MGVSHAVEEAGSTPRSIAFQLAQEVFARHDADLADAGSGVVLGMWDPAGLLYGLGLMAVAAVTLVRRAPFGGSIMVRVARCTCDPSGGRSTPEKGQNRSRFAGAGATVGPSRPTPTLGRTPMRERVALIGAGPSGMALLRALALAEDAGAQVPEVVAFERQDDWGGQWNLDWRTGADAYGEPVHSSMYRDLWINGPKECMEYPDYPFDRHFGRAVSSYLPREAMRDYILGRVAEVAERIRSQIRFATAVRWVQPLDDGGFGVTSEDLVTREAVTERFDRVVVATGHFHTPHLPSWPGVETFPGQVQHAHDYRSPEPYTGRRVLVVGSSYSGQDLALQLHRAGAAHVTTAYRARPQDIAWPAGMDEAPEVQGFDGAEVTFADGSTGEYDAVLLCTGYRHHYPFLPGELALAGPNLLAPFGLWKGVVWHADPRVLYLGATQQLFTLTLLDAQAFFARDVLLGRVPVPGDEERRADMDAWFERMTRIDGPPAALAYQGAYIQDLSSHTDCPEVDVEAVARTFLEMRDARIEDVRTFRDRRHRSTVTGTLAAAHPVPWMDRPDDSLEEYLRRFPA